MIRDGRARLLVLLALTLLLGSASSYPDPEKGMKLENRAPVSVRPAAQGNTQLRF